MINKTFYLNIVWETEEKDAVHIYEIYELAPSINADNAVTVEHEGKQFIFYGPDEYLEAMTANEDIMQKSLGIAAFLISNRLRYESENK